jgi:hypothetical protein
MQNFESAIGRAGRAFVLARDPIAGTRNMLADHEKTTSSRVPVAD